MTEFSDCMHKHVTVDSMELDVDEPMNDGSGCYASTGTSYVDIERCNDCEATRKLNHYDDDWYQRPESAEEYQLRVFGTK